MHGAARRVIFGTAAAVLVCVMGTVVARGQAAPAQAPDGQAPQMAEQVFKDVQVLKGITVDEFMDTMGMFAAATTRTAPAVMRPRSSVEAATPLRSRRR
jgi:hypothetical protein